jgi:peptide/nickel transport system ATP-binding protein
MIAAKGLSARHGERTILESIDLAVAPGAALALVGESGSGKSTLLRVIAGLHEDWSGELAIAGTPMTRRRPRALLPRVQMVFQDPYGALHPRHAIQRALAEPLAIQRIAGAAAKIDTALDAVGLDPARHRYRYPHQLSGGQRQRVAIARALILEPKAVLLDEPTSALDASVQADILDLLARLRRERGTTYVLVTHDLAVAARLCERVAVLRAGRIVEEISRAALLAGEARHPYTQELLAARKWRRESGV